jgi:hypothetical protein
VEHRDSTQGQCLSRTQKPQYQKGIGHSKKKKEIGRIGRERYSRRDREMPERVIYDFNAIYKVAELAMYARVQ